MWHHKYGISFAVPLVIQVSLFYDFYGPILEPYRLAVSHADPDGRRQVTVTLNFIIVGTVYKAYAYFHIQ
jgi:hypothetical protein